MTELFNEVKLREEIVKVWGEHGAHIVVYDEVLRKAKLYDEYMANAEGTLTATQALESQHRPPKGSTYIIEHPRQGVVFDITERGLMRFSPVRGRADALQFTYAQAQGVMGRHPVAKEAGECEVLQYGTWQRVPS